MITFGEARHMAVVEAQLRRIADALEKIARAVDAMEKTTNRNRKEQANES